MTVVLRDVATGSRRAAIVVLTGLSKAAKLIGKDVRTLSVLHGGIQLRVVMLLLRKAKDTIELRDELRRDLLTLAAARRRDDE